MGRVHGVAKGLFRHPAKRSGRNAILMHIASDLGGEKLRGDHVARFAIPVGQIVFGGHRVEGTARVFVEAHGEAKLILARFDRHRRRGQRRSARRAAIAHIDELDAGEAKPLDHGVGIASGIRAAIGKLDVFPVRARIGQSLPHREHALIQPGNAIGAAKGVDANPDYADITHDTPFAGWPKGWNAGISTGCAAAGSRGSCVSSSAMPMVMASKGTLASRASTMVSPGSST